MMAMFMARIVAMISQMHTYLQTRSCSRLNMYGFFYVNHASKSGFKHVLLLKVFKNQNYQLK